MERNNQSHFYCLFEGPNKGDKKGEWLPISKVLNIDAQLLRDFINAWKNVRPVHPFFKGPKFGELCVMRSDLCEELHRPRSRRPQKPGVWTIKEVLDDKKAGLHHYCQVKWVENTTGEIDKEWVDVNEVVSEQPELYTRYYNVKTKAREALAKKAQQESSPPKG